MARHGSIAFFFCRVEIGTDSAELEGAGFGTESAGDFLLGLHETNVAFGLVVCPGDVAVVEKTEGLRLMLGGRSQVEIPLHPYPSFS